MLDFEDSMKPAWANVMQGVENLIGAADGSLSFVKPAQGDQPEKVYQLDPGHAPAHGALPRSPPDRIEPPGR